MKRLLQAALKKHKESPAMRSHYELYTMAAAKETSADAATAAVLDAISPLKE